eukprot:PhM_4_TR10519/c1_g1_i1/m.53304
MPLLRLGRDVLVVADVLFGALGLEEVAHELVPRALLRGHTVAEGLLATPQTVLRQDRVLGVDHVERLADEVLLHARLRRQLELAGRLAEHLDEVNVQEGHARLEAVMRDAAVDAETVEEVDLVRQAARLAVALLGCGGVVEIHVARLALVGAVAVEYDPDVGMVADVPREEVLADAGAHRRDVERLGGLQHVVDDGEALRLREDHLGVVGADVVSDALRVDEVGAAHHADGEGAQRLALLAEEARGDGRHEAAVEAAREQTADRDVADETALDGGLEGAHDGLVQPFGLRRVHNGYVLRTVQCGFHIDGRRAVGLHRAVEVARLRHAAHLVGERGEAREETGKAERLAVAEVERRADRERVRGQPEVDALCIAVVLDDHERVFSDERVVERLDVAVEDVHEEWEQHGAVGVPEVVFELLRVLGADLACVVDLSVAERVVGRATIAVDGQVEGLHAVHREVHNGEAMES